MPGPAIGTAVVALALASGCVAAPPREGVGGYCHRDDQCLEGLRCLELVCHGPDEGGAGSGGALDAPDAGP